METATVQRRHFLLWVGSLSGVVACRVAWNHNLLTGARFWLVVAILVSLWIVSCTLVEVHERAKSARERGFEVLPYDKDKRP